MTLTLADTGEICAVWTAEGVRITRADALIAVSYDLLRELDGPGVWANGCGVTFRAVNATIAYEFTDFSIDDRFVIAERVFEEWK